MITELVINHTSNQHEWFQRSRQAKPGSLWRDFYVWSDTTDKYKDARIIFTDFETSNWAWDPVAHAYYWHRFYSHQPDLNYDNPRVRRMILRVLDYWFNMGVDGMRLDAVPYLFEREGTNCENLPETHAFLKELRAHVDKKFKDRMLLAEANQWPEDAAAYFGNGDECHMAFHFPIMPRLFMAVRMEDRFPIIDILEQSLNIPPTCQWAMFLRNHDELTLEMVTDEERDYMYKAYAQDPRARINVGIRRRLAPLLDNNRRRIELMKGLLLLPAGDAHPLLRRRDRHGRQLPPRRPRRRPHPHAVDRRHERRLLHGQPAAALLAGHHRPGIPFHDRQRGEPEPQPLLLAVVHAAAHRPARKASRPSDAGSMQFLPSDNSKVLTFLRTYDEENILVVANLSRQSQAVNIQMPDQTGYHVRDMFSGNEFPRITEAPYVVTLTPHAFYWFTLERPVEPARQEAEQPVGGTVRHDVGGTPGQQRRVPDSPGPAGTTCGGPGGSAAKAEAFAS